MTTPEWEQDARDTEAGWATASLDAAIDRADAAHDVIESLHDSAADVLREVTAAMETWSECFADGYDGTAPATLWIQLCEIERMVKALRA